MKIFSKVAIVSEEDYIRKSELLDFINSDKEVRGDLDLIIYYLRKQLNVILDNPQLILTENISNIVKEELENKLLELRINQNESLLHSLIEKIDELESKLNYNELTVAELKYELEKLKENGVK